MSIASGSSPGGDAAHQGADPAHIALTLSDMLESTDPGAWCLEIGSGDRLYWDDRSKALFGLDPAINVNCGIWRDAIAPDDRLIAEEHLARALNPDHPCDAYVCEFRAMHPDGGSLWLAVDGCAVFEPDATGPAGRRAVRIVGTFRDMTAVRRAEQACRQADALLRTITEASPGLIYAKDREGRLLLANKPVMALIGKPWHAVRNRTDFEFLDNQAEAAKVMANDRRIMETGQAEEFEEVVTDEQAQTRIFQSTKAPMYDDAGNVIGLIGMSVEVTERRRLEERLGRLLDELDHRVKNALATVLAIASHTLQGTDPDMRHALEARLMALASAHDILAREQWEGANLDDVVAGVLGHERARIQVTGPPLRLRPRAALALALGLHEMTANSKRHGALSIETGRVELTWSIDSGVPAQFQLSWREHDGPPVAVPIRRGFGTRLIERGLAQDISGSAVITFHPSGVACRVQAPLVEVAMADDAVCYPNVRSLWG